MSEVVTTPAPAAVTPEATPAPSAEKTDISAVATTPEAQKVDGNTEQQKPDPEKTEEPTPAELARKQRNKERWQNMRNSHQEALAEVGRLRMENERLKAGRVDYSQITDPEQALAARTADLVADRMAGDKEAQIKDARDRADTALREAWGAMKEEARARVPDFDQVVTENTPLHQRMAPYIVESENGADIAYWLGKNLDAARDLYMKFETRPAEALIEFGRLQGKITAASAKPVSTAPRPAPILSGSGSPAPFNISTASVDDTAEMLRKQGYIR